MELGCFREDFADELLFCDSEEKYPSWLGCYRDKAIANIDKHLADLCYVLKRSGVSFKIKYPILVNGRWKFADIYVDGVVVLLIQDHETIGLPCHSKTDRELSFGDSCKVLPIHTYEIENAVELLKKRI